MNWISDRLRRPAKTEPVNKPKKARSWELEDLDSLREQAEAAAPGAGDWLAALVKQREEIDVILRIVERGQAFSESPQRNETLEYQLGRYLKASSKPTAFAQAALLKMLHDNPGSDTAGAIARISGNFHNHVCAPSLPLDYGDGSLRILGRTRSELGRWRAVEKEPWTVEWIERCMAAGGAFYDVGANVGAYALIAGKLAGEPGRVYAFEPSYSTYTALVDNVHLNAMDRLVIALPFALSDSLSLVDMHYRSAKAGSAMYHLGDSSVDSIKPVATEMVYPAICYPLDRVIADLALPPPAHVKIDVDGHEEALLEGARGSLSAATLQSVMIECSGDVTRAMVRRVLGEEIGLTLAGEWTSAPEAGADRVSYLLFERR